MHIPKPKVIQMHRRPRYQNLTKSDVPKLVHFIGEFIINVVCLRHQRYPRSIRLHYSHRWHVLAFLRPSTSMESPSRRDRSAIKHPKSQEGSETVKTHQACARTRAAFEIARKQLKKCPDTSACRLKPANRYQTYLVETQRPGA